jgi:hypothetical protein
VQYESVRLHVAGLGKTEYRLRRGGYKLGKRCRIVVIGQKSRGSPSLWLL